MARNITNNSNTLQEITPIFGAPQSSLAGQIENTSVLFAFGETSKLIDRTSSSVGLIGFGYNDELNSGAVAVNGKLVTSKILDVSVINQELTVSYLDENGLIDSYDVSILDSQAITDIQNSINDINSSIAGLTDKQTLYVHFYSISENEVSCDTSILQIIEAYNNGCEIKAICDTYVLDLVYVVEEYLSISFSTFISTAGLSLYISTRPDTDPDDDIWRIYYNSYQKSLTFDTVPTENSENPVMSGGIYNAIHDVSVNISDINSSVSDLYDNKPLFVTFTAAEDIENLYYADKTPTEIVDAYIHNRLIYGVIDTVVLNLLSCETDDYKTIVFTTNYLNNVIFLNNNSAEDDTDWPMTIVALETELDYTNSPIYKYDNNILIRTDNDTTYVNSQSKLCAADVSIETLYENNSSYIKTYNFYKTRENYQSLLGSINIPKDQMLKDVHLCKAIYDENTQIYTETAKQSDPDYDTAPGDVYLHFIWHVADPSTDDNLQETFIKVTDMAPVYTGDGEWISVNDNVISFNDEPINTINSSIAIHNSSITQILSDIGTIDDKIIDQQRDIETNTNDIAGLDRHITKTDTELSKLDVSVESLISDFSNFNSSIVDLYNDIDSSLDLINSSAIGKLYNSSTYSSVIIRNMYDIDNASVIKENALKSISLKYNTIKELDSKGRPVIPNIYVDIDVLTSEYASGVAEVLASDASSIESLQNMVNTTCYWYTLGSD